MRAEARHEAEQVMQGVGVSEDGDRLVFHKKLEADVSAAKRNIREMNDMAELSPANAPAKRLSSIPDDMAEVYHAATGANPHGSEDEIRHFYRNGGKEFFTPEGRKRYG